MPPVVVLYSDSTGAWPYDERLDGYKIDQKSRALDLGKKNPTLDSGWDFLSCDSSNSISATALAAFTAAASSLPAPLSWRPRFDGDIYAHLIP